MIVASVSWRLSLPGCGSLKEKRRVVKSLKDRLRHRFNVSVAETGSQDLLTRAEITAALVSSDMRFAQSALDRIERFLLSDGRSVITRTERRIH